MEAFSFRRMMLFCRLQMVEMYGRNIGRTLRVGAAAVLVICLFSLIFGEEGESVSVAERMMGASVCHHAAERDVPRAVGACGFGFLHAAVVLQ